MRLRFKDIKALRGQTTGQKLFHATESLMTPEEKERYQKIVKGGEENEHRNGKSTI